MPTLCGMVPFGSWGKLPIGEDTAVEVQFDAGLKFDVVPRVVTQVAAIDAQANCGTRIGTWCSDVTQQGFRLHARSWADSVTHSIKVTWVATTDFEHVQLGCEAVGGWPDGEVPIAETRCIQFDHAFPCAPDVAVGFASLDAIKGRNVRLWQESVEAQCRSFSLRCGTWGGSKTFGTESSWIACASPGVLQAGSLEIDGWPSSPLRRGADKALEVRFGRAFDAAPNVVVFLAGIDACSSAPTRVDTWAEEVRRDGFRLHIRTWEDSVTWRVRCSWVAVPSSSSDVAPATWKPLPSHLPPSDYVVEGPPLGQGWWGVTHCTRHIADGRKYAVKTCKHSFKQNATYLRQELKNLVALPVHENVLRYNACCVHMDRLHIITEYLNAMPLSALVPGPDGAFSRKHPPVTLLRWMSQLFAGLAALHKVGIVHRDLHGDNVLVERDLNGSPIDSSHAVRIIDFGVAKAYGEMKPLPMSGEAGCWQYFSPERRRGEEFDDRDDVWAAGCHLTELATGHVIRKRQGCGDDGANFALTSSVVAEAILDCGDSRCRQLAEAVLVADMLKRPRADTIRDMLHGDAIDDSLGSDGAPEKRRRCSSGGRRNGCVSSGAGPSGRGRQRRASTSVW
eukprot:TRINITY_DN67607_c0_g1_i1.p1 TRINITY_DN67607_c0_g1~~TRINITY_DN67607_c0_g1_i1.p1  ORF type:complete len:621 (+),score=100.00 TRINITY_DN67607_c0_g1_i1:72-1934(+)